MIKDQILYLFRTFSDNRPPEFFRGLPPDQQLRFIESSMHGYAAKQASRAPVRQSELPKYHWTPQEGNHGYTCIVMLPPEQPQLSRLIKGHEGTTGREDIDAARGAPVKSLEAIKDNFVIVTEFPVEQLAGHIILVSEEKGRAILYQGDQVEM